jgi:hypothetical protein
MLNTQHPSTMLEQLIADIVTAARVVFENELLTWDNIIRVSPIPIEAKAGESVEQLPILRIWAAISSEDDKRELTLEIDFERVQKLFDFAWDHTPYRANLVSLREALGLETRIKLPTDLAYYTK